MYLPSLRKYLNASVAGAVTLVTLSAHAELSKDVNQAAAQIQNSALSKTLTAQSCPAVLRSLHNEIYNLAPDHFANDKSVVETANGTDAISQLFKARLTLNRRFKEMVVGSEFADKTELDNCANQLRVVLRTVRDLEDVIGLTALHKADLAKKAANPNVILKKPAVYPLQDNSWPNMLMNREVYGNQKFDKSMVKTGDIFLVKGTMFAAAPISRVGTIDNQFTHIAIAYVDDGSLFGAKNKGQIYVMAAEPDYGFQITSFEFFQKDLKSRLLHYRYKETSSNAAHSARIATEAAKYIAAIAYPRVNEKDKSDTTMIDRVSTAGGKMPKVIPYNFAMDLAKKDELFCSQVVSFSWDHVCQTQNLNCQRFEKYELPGRSSIPIQVSQFDVQKNSLARMLELQKSEIFSPVDVEIDPRFELLHEWRDYSIIDESRIMDMTISKIFQYIEKQNYDFVMNDALEGAAKFGNTMIKQAGMLPSYSPDNYAKGIMMMAFMIKYTGPGKLIVDRLDSVPPEKVKAFLMANSIPEPIAAKLAANSKQVTARILNHVSITTRIANLAAQNLKVKERFLTTKQMDTAIDLIRSEDCKRYVTGQGGPVMYHDFFRRTNTTDKAKQCDQVATPLNDIMW